MQQPMCKYYLQLDNRRMFERMYTRIEWAVMSKRFGNNKRTESTSASDYIGDIMDGIKTAPIMFILICQFGLSMQACQECTCCKYGASVCDSNKTCTEGCIAGYFGAKCTKNCLENCKTCVNGTGCTECKRGYYTAKCNIPCGRGCVYNTCSISSGECTCKSSYFVKGKCDTCSSTMYGVDCNNTCPSNCGSCISETECTWCKHTAYYGSYCQYRCSVGCVDEICNKGTGYCIKGCKSGFVGYKCDMCFSGLYGPYCDLNCTENCDNICSTLCVNTTCNHTTAECLYGCIDGFKGHKCAKAIIQDQEAFYTRSTLIGSTIGTFLAGGIVVGIASLIAFIAWRRRNTQTKQIDVHGYESTITPSGNRSNDGTHVSDSSVTYEDLKSHEERLYSQITTSPQISPPATNYVNYSSY